MEIQSLNIYQAGLYIALLFALIIATVTDLSARRIPNSVTFGLMATALLLHGLLSGWGGVFFSLKGLGLGLALLLLPYILGGMGAADVKLMAGVGAVIGPIHIFKTFFIIALLGGLVAIVMLVVRKDLLPAMKRIGRALMALIGGVGATALRIAPTTLKQQGIPYGAVITGGTLIYFAYTLITGKGVPFY